MVAEIRSYSATRALVRSGTDVEREGMARIRRSNSSQRCSLGLRTWLYTASFSSSEPLLSTRRVLQNLLQLEDRYCLASSYFVCLQSELKPYMREKVTEWMWEVCEGEYCQQDVFPLAVNCMDRFLSVVKLKRSQLQLLGTVCLFLASKLRQVVPLVSRKLCQYTDNSVTQEELLV
ncbi:G1/S-specific cyclin-D2-like [Tachypleus tridentatus]|uniref:G1/S-specific cyclin-D2-like n=1 Tax=Tachypleus tridentatus TaxID=6853 RepID=UPI003FD43D92